ncbi:P2 phage tail completion protein R (GpR) [Gilliamella apicola SCGC AB-598-I20]|nr:P2 phage tail completion protein R (GpR) [Gilliamella apicola SCGC AB-598-I20]
MKKINQLKQFLLERNLLNNSTASSHQFTIKDGFIEPFSVDNLGFQYHFTLTISLSAYCYPFNELIASIVSWIQSNQPEALINTHSRQQAIKFNVENITDNQCDLTIELKLSERIKATKKQDKLEFDSLSDRLILQEPLEKYSHK